MLEHIGIWMPVGSIIDAIEPIDVLNGDVWARHRRQARHRWARLSSNRNCACHGSNDQCNTSQFHFAHSSHCSDTALFGTDTHHRSTVRYRCRRQPCASGLATCNEVPAILPN